MIISKTKIFPNWPDPEHQLIQELQSVLDSTSDKGGNYCFHDNLYINKWTNLNEKKYKIDNENDLQNINFKDWIKTYNNDYIIHIAINCIGCLRTIQYVANLESDPRLCPYGFVDYVGSKRGRSEFEISESGRVIAFISNSRFKRLRRLINRVSSFWDLIIETHDDLFRYKKSKHAEFIKLWKNQAERRVVGPDTILGSLDVEKIVSDIAKLKYVRIRKIPLSKREETVNILKSKEIKPEKVNDVLNMITLMLYNKSDKQKKKTRKQVNVIRMR